MAITRANAEAILIGRLGTLMTEAGLDGTTVDGTNADLNDPFASALRSMGYAVADITNVSDVDLSALAEEDYNEFLDRAELRVLETIEGNYVLVDITAGPRSEKLSQLLDHVRARKDQLWEKIKEEHGTVALEAGYIEQVFAEHETE